MYVKFRGGTWRIIPVSKWLITMVIISPLIRVVGPLPNGLSMVLINGVILTTYIHWDDPPSRSATHEPRKKTCLVGLYRGWNPTQLYRDYFINHEKRIPINQAVKQYPPSCLSWAPYREIDWGKFSGQINARDRGGSAVENLLEDVVVNRLVELKMASVGWSWLSRWWNFKDFRNFHPEFVGKWKKLIRSNIFQMGWNHHLVVF